MVIFPQQYLDTVVAGFDGAEEAVMSIETCTELNNVCTLCVYSISVC